MGDYDLWYGDVHASIEETISSLKNLKSHVSFMAGEGNRKPSSSLGICGPICSSWTPVVGDVQEITNEFHPKQNFWMGRGFEA